jgi:N-acylglucosamine 2-epimerase
MDTFAPEDLAEVARLKERYRRNLEESVIPFWLRHSPDRDSGGYFCCLERDGTVFDTDKFMWLQGRGVWMLSKLYNTYRPQPAWIAYARTGVEFMKAHGRDPNGDWYFALDRAGRPLVEAYNIFSDCFAAAGFAEYFRATGDEEARGIARATYRRIQERKDNPKGRFTKQIGANRPIRGMSFPMIQVWLAEQMGDLAEPGVREKYLRDAIEQVTTLHIDRDRRAVYERVHPDGTHPDCMEGRLLTPGHALEVLWFILRAVESRPSSPAPYPPAESRRIADLAVEAMLWTADRGWDRDFGGFSYYLDADGHPPEKLEWDMKLWWVHAEALCAFLLAWKLTGRPVFRDWFRRVDEYVWKHFDDPRHGEWFGYLHRAGDPATTQKGGKWKGCFHVPRALLTCIGFFEEIEAAGAPGMP